MKGKRFIGSDKDATCETELHLHHKFDSVKAGQPLRKKIIKYLLNRIKKKNKKQKKETEASRIKVREGDVIHRKRIQKTAKPAPNGASFLRAGECSTESFFFIIIISPLPKSLRLARSNLTSTSPGFHRLQLLPIIVFSFSSLLNLSAPPLQGKRSVIKTPILLKRI